jgi:glycosyltransferase involved in cell wall biosynthesis
VRAIIEALSASDQLAEFNTTLSYQPTVFQKILPAALKQQLLRRNFPEARGKIHSHPYREILRFILPQLGFTRSVKHEKGWASVDAVYKNFDKAVAKRITHLAKKKSIDAVYAYEDGALETFTRAKALGLKCIYDLPIAFWQTTRKLLNEEAMRLPEWANTLKGGIQDSEEKLERKSRELELADIVVSPGQFVMDSIPQWARNKRILMQPFGSPHQQNLYTRQNTQKPGKPLRVLFAGSMGQRKGLGDLFAAIKLLNQKDVELVVMGSLMSPLRFYRSELSGFKYEPNRPHDQVLSLMRSCDILCLPSIVEGRALVMQEAMSQGLPLIITPNTGGADLIKEGETGFLVPIRSPEAIAEKINWFLENRSRIPAMCNMARQHAASYTWENYGSEIVHSLS